MSDLQEMKLDHFTSVSIKRAWWVTAYVKLCVLFMLSKCRKTAWILMKWLSTIWPLWQRELLFSATEVDFTIILYLFMQSFFTDAICSVWNHTLQTVCYATPWGKDRIPGHRSCSYGCYSYITLYKARVGNSFFQGTTWETRTVQVKATALLLQTHPTNTSSLSLDFKTGWLYTLARNESWDRVSRKREICSCNVVSSLCLVLFMWYHTVIPCGN